jgi:hypothetical protein
MRYELFEKGSREGIFGAYLDRQAAAEEAERIAVDAEVEIEVYDHQTGQVVYRADAGGGHWLVDDTD